MRPRRKLSRISFRWTPIPDVFDVYYGRRKTPYCVAWYPETLGAMLFHESSGEERVIEAPTFRKMGEIVRKIVIGDTSVDPARWSTCVINGS